MVFVKKKTRYDKKAQLQVTEWVTTRGVLHRSGDKPARIWQNGREEWWFNGALHREGDKPAIYQSDSDGTFVFEHYFKGNLHRDNEQAAVSRYDGTVWRYEWYKHGLKHRDGDKPAVIYDWNSGKLVRIWFKQGRRHRENGPAFTRVQPWGDTREEWYYYGKRHRNFGFPAVICKDSLGVSTKETFLEHGKEYYCFRIFGFTMSWSYE
jgi:hypothetical protein